MYMIVEKDGYELPVALFSHLKSVAEWLGCSYVNACKAVREHTVVARLYRVERIQYI